MNITILGASAGIGLETVKRGLNRNHSITTLVFVFNPENLHTSVSVRGKLTFLIEH
jgi:putative NADH-flavin reductase